MADNTKTNLVYNWFLVKTDGYGNGISIKYLSTASNASVKILPGHNYYQLYLNASFGNDVSTTK
ncbi:MAG: hypothetical protein H7096_12865 [Flavobacterium sp.]|nr:hypothetical protein [Pedobacter sp.]